jgi:hypothetical protein
MNSLTIVGALALGMISYSGSCGIKTPDIATASSNVKDASQKLSEGMKELSKIDPAGLKHLMEQNDQLRNVAETLRGELNSVESPGNIGVGPHSRAFLEITGYKGRLRVDAWLDSEANKFINNRVLVENEVALPLDATIATTMLNGTMDWCVKKAPLVANTCFLKYAYPNKAPQIDGEYKKAADTALAQFLTKPFVIPSTDMALHDFGQRFGQSGEHSLFFRITPEKEDAQGNWEFEYKAYVDEPNHDKEQFLVGRIDSQTSKNYKLGQPLAPILANVFKVVITDH